MAAAVDPDDERRQRAEEMERLLREQEEPNNENDALAPAAQPQQPPPLPPPPPPPKKSLFSYRSISFFAFFTLVYSAFRTRKQYYLAMTYLSTSKWAYVVTGNAVLALAMTLFDATVQVFLGGLRQSEAEGLQDFFRWNVTETCLALTMFRSELTVGVALQFVALILIKCLHHVATLRELHLRLTEEAVQPGWWCIKPGHSRILLYMMVLSMIDMRTMQLSVMSLLNDSWPSVAVLFAFEAAIMLTTSWSHMLLWWLHVVDSFISMGHELGWTLASRLYHPWKEHKATLVFAVELQAQAVTFLFYCTFFALVLSFYGMPINLFRNVYMSFITLKERLGAFLKYRRLMASMDRFASATEEELAESERTCIICRDEMHVGDCKRLPGCAHIFHKSCLREWLVQQQTCPTCRSDITAMEARERAQEVAAAAATLREAAADAAVNVGDGEASEDRTAGAQPTNEAPSLEETKEAPTMEAYSLYTITASPCAVWANETNDKEAVKPKPVTLEAGTIVIGRRSNASDGSHELIEGCRTIRIPDGWIAEGDAKELMPVPSGGLQQQS